MELKQNWSNNLKVLRATRKASLAEFAEEIGIDRSSILLQVRREQKRSQKAREKKAFREFQTKTTGLKDRVNPEKMDKLRAANAEEALIALLFRHPDLVKEVKDRLPPEKFCTAFNRRVYEIIMGNILNGKAFDLTSITEGFTLEESSSVARMLAQYPSTTASERDAEEYIRVILQEYDRFRTEKVMETGAGTQEIQQYLQKLKDQKK